MTTNLEKNIFLFDHSNNIKIDIVVSTICEINLESKLNDAIYEQYARKIRNFVKKFEQSEIPTKFIKEQDFIVTNKLPESLYGAFSLVGDTIYADADSVSDITPIKSSFLLGHEMGHKIDKYSDTRRIYEDLSKVFSVSSYDRQKLSEIYADVIGNIIANSNNYHILSAEVSSDKNEYAKKMVLSSMYR